MSRYQTRILTTEAEVTAIAENWKECLQRQEGRGHIEHHPDWLLMDVRMDSSSNIIVVTLYEEGHLVGIAPFLIHRGTWDCRFGKTIVMRFPVFRARLYGSALVAPEDREAQEAILQAMALTPIPYHLIFVQSLSTESFFWRVLQESPVIRKHFWIDSLAGITPHRMIHLTGTFEEYLEKFSGRTRFKMRRSIRQLEEACQGQVQVERITMKEQLSAFLEQTQLISERSWQGTQYEKVIRPTGSEAKRLEICANRGWLRSYLLRCGQKSIAFAIGYQIDGTYYYAIPAYDPEWSDYAPGKVLLYRLLEDLFAENRPEWLDFGHGNHEYKQFWANCAFDSVNTYLVRKSPYTAFVLATRKFTYGTFNTLATTVGAVLGRLGLMEKVHSLLHRRHK